METKLSFRDALKRLARFGIKDEQVYLIDLVLLVEMAWADGRIQEAEIEILFEYLGGHVRSINRLAGCKVISEESAVEFIKNLLHKRPEQDLLDEIRYIIGAIRIDNKNPVEAQNNRIAILNACLDIAACAVTEYPYGLTERFTAEEKAYYHKLQELLSGKSCATSSSPTCLNTL